MIICVTGMFDMYDRHGIPTGHKELLVSHGIDMNTDKTVILPCEHPAKIGARFDGELGEWVLDD